jgi:hypothetical protein
LPDGVDVVGVVVAQRDVPVRRCWRVRGRHCGLPSELVVDVAAGPVLAGGLAGEVVIRVGCWRPAAAPRATRRSGGGVQAGAVALGVERVRANRAAGLPGAVVRDGGDSGEPVGLVVAVLIAVPGRVEVGAPLRGPAA